MAQDVVGVAASGEYYVLLAGQHTYSERLIPATVPKLRAQRAPPFGVLVTGGTKGLGLEQARHAVEKGAKAAVLLSRGGTLTQHELESLALRDTAVFAVSCDTSNSQDLAAVASWAREELPPIEVTTLGLPMSQWNFGQRVESRVSGFIFYSQNNEVC